MQQLLLTSMHIYPIKACRGITLLDAQVQERGLQHDRRWMLIDHEHYFLWQGDYSQLATIAPTLTQDALLINAPGMEPLHVPFEQQWLNQINVQISRSTVRGLVSEQPINEWFSQFLGTACRLVYISDESKRTANQNDAINDDVVSLGDGYPFLLTNTASLEELNRRITNKQSDLPMNRFRPNLVISGAAPFSEDRWQRIRIGSVEFHIVKPCDRCEVTTIDQERGVVDGKEPLRTLAAFRKEGSKVLFGQYLIPESPGRGSIRVGDMVEVLATKEV